MDLAPLVRVFLRVSFVQIKHVLDVAKLAGGRRPFGTEGSETKRNEMKQFSRVSGGQYTTRRYWKQDKQVRLSAGS